MRVALGIEYDGSPFHGWQSQRGGMTVQDAVEGGVSAVADHSVRVVCAGRTDAGVHAVGQVVHFETVAERAPHSWVFGVNANLPETVSVTWAKSVAEEFHARYSALRRHYRYVIFNRPVRPALVNRKVAWEYRALDVRRMRAAGRLLLGEHDFSSYRALACQSKSPVRTVYRVDLARHGHLVILDVEANAFLHHMVRNIAGVLMTIGAGEREPEWAQEVLEYRDRTLGGVTAPPQGLYFMRVDYPAELEIPGPAQDAETTQRASFWHIGS